MQTANFCITPRTSFTHTNIPPIPRHLIPNLSLSHTILPQAARMHVHLHQFQSNQKHFDMELNTNPGDPLLISTPPPTQSLNTALHYTHRPKTIIPFNKSHGIPDVPTGI